MAEAITRDELRAAIDGGSVVVLEALPPEYFAKGHLPGARNLPLDDIEALAPTVAPDREQAIVTYCTGETCPNSGIAADRLTALGYTNVRTFAGGKEAWEAAGLPLQQS